LFIPVKREDVVVYELSHARVLGQASQRIRVGGFVHLVREGGAWDRAQIGPSVRISAGPGITLTADAARGFAHTPSVVLTSVEWVR
jgi:hypothetical protein